MESKVKRFNLKIRRFPVFVEGGWGGIVLRFLCGFGNPPIYFCFQENQINPINNQDFRPAGLKSESLPGNNLDVTWKKFRLLPFFIQKRGIGINPAVSVQVIARFA